jgi:hypothetical protein
MSREILLFFYIYWFEKHVLEIDREAMNRTQLRSVDQGKLCTGSLAAVRRRQECLRPRTSWGRAEPGCQEKGTQGSQMTTRARRRRDRCGRGARQGPFARACVRESAPKKTNTGATVRSSVDTTCMQLKREKHGHRAAELGSCIASDHVH